MMFLAMVSLGNVAEMLCWYLSLPHIVCLLLSHTHLWLITCLFVSHASLSPQSPIRPDRQVGILRLSKQMLLCWYLLSQWNIILALVRPISQAKVVIFLFYFIFFCPLAATLSLGGLPLAAFLDHLLVWMNALLNQAALWPLHLHLSVNA